MLTATDGALTPVDSAPFDVTIGPAAQLVYTTQPSTSNTGSAISPAPVVVVQDAGGNKVTTDTSNVTLAIKSGSGTGGAVLTCTANPVAAVAGVATFAGCAIDLAGLGYVLTATDGALTSADSVAFTVIGACKAAFTTQPAGAVGSVAFTTQPVVTVQDVVGSTVTSDTSNVTLTIGTNPAGGTLTCTSNTVAAVAGVATFSGCSIDQLGAGYTLHAADGVLTPADSASFNIVAGRSRSCSSWCRARRRRRERRRQDGTPTAQTAGTPFNVTVNAVDANWNVVEHDGHGGHHVERRERDAAGQRGAGGRHHRLFSVTLKTAGSRDRSRPRTSPTGRRRRTPAQSIDGQRGRVCEAAGAGAGRNGGRRVRRRQDGTHRQPDGRHGVQRDGQRGRRELERRQHAPTRSASLPVTPTPRCRPTRRWWPGRRRSA